MYLAFYKSSVDGYLGYNLLNLYYIYENFSDFQF